MTKVRFIGDIHGDLGAYFALLDHAEYNGIRRTVQVGDFGVGFGDRLAPERIDHLLDAWDDMDNEFIRGNHDDPEKCKLSRHWIPDGTFLDGIFYMGGADSIDKAWRTKGRDWWPEEELSDEELERCIDTYKEVKPHILVTHDCSESFAREVMIPIVKGVSNMSRTRLAIDRMYAAHKPDVHIFGHWHHDIDYYAQHYADLIGTRMICLGINKYIDLEV